MTRRNVRIQGWVFPLFSPDSDDRLSLNFHRFVILYRSCDTQSVGLEQYCLPKGSTGLRKILFFKTVKKHFVDLYQIPTLCGPLCFFSGLYFACRVKTHSNTLILCKSTYSVHVVFQVPTLCGPPFFSDPHFICSLKIINNKVFNIIKPTHSAQPTSVTSSWKNPKLKLDQVSIVGVNLNVIQ